MIKKILAVIVDYYTTEEACRLSCQLACPLAYQSTCQPTERESNPLWVQVVHFDNGNQTPVQLSEKQKALGIRLERSETNLGYAGALNEAVNRAVLKNESYDGYLFLNSDLEMPPETIEKLAQVLNLHPKVAVVGPIVRNSRNDNKIWGARGIVKPYLGTTAMSNWHGGILPPNSYVPGSCFLVRSEAFHKIGGLPTTYKLYFEETEFCIRLQRLGWQLWVDREATADHHVNSLKAGIPSKSFSYYFIRNNLKFWKTVYGISPILQFPRLLYVWFREIVLPLIRRSRNWKETQDRLNYSLAGLWDGILFVNNKTPQFEKKLFDEKIRR